MDLETCLHGHPRTPENTYRSPKSGKGYCRPCSNEQRVDKRAGTETFSAQRREALRQRAIEYNQSRFGRPPKTDGWEDIAGRKPAKVPNRDWYDQVVVDRILAGRDPGRSPYRLETLAVLSAIEPHSESYELVKSGGFTTQMLSRRRRYYAEQGVSA